MIDFSKKQIVLTFSGLLMLAVAGWITAASVFILHVSKTQFDEGFKVGSEYVRTTHPGIQYEQSGLNYCQGGGVYYQVVSFSPRGMTFKVKKAVTP